MNDSADNVLVRLDRVKRIFGRHGIHIRQEAFAVPTERTLEAFSSQTAILCELRGRQTIFLDTTQPAQDQIIALRQILEAVQQGHGTRISQTPLSPLRSAA